MSELKVTDTNEIIDLINCSVSTDIEQFVWSFSAEVANKELLAKLIPPANLGQNYIDVTFTLGSETWELIIEDTNCNDTNFSYSVTGKSKSVILAEPYAPQVTNLYLNTTAQVICETLCTTSGIALDWQIMDWPIAYFKVEKRYAIDIINEIVKDIGAKLQSLPNGTLTVIYYPALNPGDLSTATALYTVDTNRNVFDRAEKFINRENYDCVFVTKDATLLDAPSISAEEIGEGDDKTLNVYVNPVISHDVLNLHHSSESNASLFYEGTFTERVTEDVMIEAGEGKLSKQFTSLVNVKWQQTEIGALTIAENGKIACNGAGDTGLATIIYNTTYLRYLLQRLSNIAKTLVMSDELMPPVLTTGIKPMPPIVVKTLSSTEALAARANAELWTNFDSKEYQLSAAYTGAAVLCGKIVKVNVVREEVGFNAWVKSVTINSTADEINQSITCERPCF